MPKNNNRSKDLTQKRIEARNTLSFCKAELVRRRKNNDYAKLLPLDEKIVEILDKISEKDLDYDLLDINKREDLRKICANKTGTRYVKAPGCGLLKVRIVDSRGSSKKVIDGLVETVDSDGSSKKAANERLEPLERLVRMVISTYLLEKKITEANRFLLESSQLPTKFQRGQVDQSDFILTDDSKRSELNWGRLRSKVKERKLTTSPESSDTESSSSKSRR